MKVCSLLFLLPEVILAVALLFNQVTLTDFWQISLGLLVLWPMMPLILRMKERTLFGVIAKELTMGSRRIQKYTHLFLMLIPFAVPPLMGLQEEMCGRIIGLRYVFAAIFIVSLIALYAWGVTSAVCCKNKADVGYELFMFHFVKIPLFIIAWFIYMIVILVANFYINGFDGIQ